MGEIYPEQLLLKYIKSSSVDTSMLLGRTTTVTGVSTNMIAGLDYLRKASDYKDSFDKRIGQATSSINEAINRQQFSERYNSRKFVSETSKEVFLFSNVIDAGLEDELGESIMIKTFFKDGVPDKEKIVLLEQFWAEYQYAHLHGTLPKGELVARTNEHLLTLFYSGGNLFYDHLYDSASTEGALNALINIYSSFNRFAYAFIKRHIIPVIEEDIFGKFREAIQALPNPDLVLRLFEVEKKDIYLGPKISYTDPKPANVILPDDLSLEEFINHPESGVIVDADRFNHVLPAAYNWANAILEPAFNLSIDEALLEYEQLGLMTPELKESTLLNMFFFLSRQIYLIGKRVKQPDCLEADRSRYQGFCNRFQEIIPYLNYDFVKATTLSFDTCD